MEFITYNNVQLQVVKTNYVSVTPVNNDDGTIWLASDWDVDVVCHIQPAAMSYVPSPGGQPGAPPAVQPGQKPGNTFNAIKAALETPRGILTIVAGGATILDVPGFSIGQQRFPCDAGGGPFCRVYSITQMIGVKHFVAHCRFTARVNNSNNFDYSVAAQASVLSNVWTVIEDIDDLLYPVRTIAGQAILRADVMRDQQLTANSFRSSFFFPVPSNFQRESAHVELSTDGLTLTYTIRDEGKCYNLGGQSPVRRFEGYLTGFYKAGGKARPFLKSGQDLVRGLSNPLNGLGAIASAPGNLYQHVNDSLPKYHCGVRADMWGSRDATRASLFNIAISLCLQQLQNTAGDSVGTEEFIGRMALHEKYVSVEVTRAWGDDLAVFVGQGGGLRGLLNKFRANDTQLNLFPAQGALPPIATIPGQGLVFASQANNFGAPGFGGNGPNAGSQAAINLNQDTNSLTTFITQLLLNPQQIPPTPASRFAPPIRDS